MIADAGEIGISIFFVVRRADRLAFFFSDVSLMKFMQTIDRKVEQERKTINTQRNY